MATLILKKTRPDTSRFSQVTRHEKMSGENPQALRQHGSGPLHTDGDVTLIRKPRKQCHTVEKIPGSVGNALGGSSSFEGSSSPCNVSPKVDIAGLTKMQLRERYPREATSHRNMLSRQKERGAIVHPTFLDFTSFLEHVGPIPAKGATLDRIDNTDPEYGPGKVAWADKRTQNSNKSDTLLFRYSRTGEVYTTSRLAALRNVSAATIRKQRERGWTDDEIIEGKRASAPIVLSAFAPAKAPASIKAPVQLSEAEQRLQAEIAYYAEYRATYGEEYVSPTYAELLSLDDIFTAISRDHYIRHFAKSWPTQRRHVIFRNLRPDQVEFIAEIDPAYVKREQAKEQKLQQLKNAL